MDSKEELQRTAKHASETTQPFKKESDSAKNKKEEKVDTDALGKTEEQENQYGKTTANPAKEREAMPETASKEQMPNKGIEAAQNENADKASTDKTFKENKPVEGEDAELGANKPVEGDAK